MTPLRTRAIDAVTRETCPGFPAVCWACRDTAERAVDALLAAGLLHDPTCEARIERAARAMFYDKFPDGSDALWEHLCAGFLRSARAALAAADQEDTDA